MTGNRQILVQLLAKLDVGSVAAQKNFGQIGVNIRRLAQTDFAGERVAGPDVDGFEPAGASISRWKISTADLLTGVTWANFRRDVVSAKYILRN